MDDRVLEELYGLPLEEFTDARNAFADRVRDEGDRATATEIRKLKKPTVAAWTVNQLAREHSKELGRLMDLRTDTADGTSADLRKVGAERRKLIASLTEHAREILEESGHSASASTIESVSKTLLAGASEEERAAITGGYITKELEPAGFEGFGGVPFESVEEEEPEVEPRAARRAEELAKKADDAERTAKEMERDADRAMKEAEKLAQRAATARRKADEARTRADEALDKLG